MPSGARPSRCYSYWRSLRRKRLLDHERAHVPQGEQIRRLGRRHPRLDGGVELGVVALVAAPVPDQQHLLGDLVRAHPGQRLYTASKIPPKNREWPTRPGVPLDEVFPNDYIREYAHRTLNNLGLLLGRSGDLTRAETYFRDALARRPAYGEAANNLALVLVGQGRGADAVTILEALLTRAPDNEHAYLTLARIHLQAGRTAEGVSALERLLQRNPAHPQAQALLRELGPKR